MPAHMDARLAVSRKENNSKILPPTRRLSYLRVELRNGMNVLLPRFQIFAEVG